CGHGALVPGLVRLEPLDRERGFAARHDRVRHDDEVLRDVNHPLLRRLWDRGRRALRSGAWSSSCTDPFRRPCTRAVAVEVVVIGGGSRECLLVRWTAMGPSAKCLREGALGGVRRPRSHRSAKNLLGTPCLWNPRSYLG